MRLLRIIAAAAIVALPAAASAQYQSGYRSPYNSYSVPSLPSLPSLPRIQSPNYGTGSNWNSTGVQGYTRQDGTYVAPHRRSMPDSSTSNNWSTQGNYNPYTGRPGTQRQSGYGGWR